ncbi:unnamed protein product [Hyaloperonospora brassicae]|uniref:PWWP domain-containing protein n=1 Tax=Hyaloperonospora brassicae TaxID=162125 RepID=A0AAV0TQL0_HYABA|nr:unnamed protein product [Hyaloperonospora brassicae]
MSGDQDAAALATPTTVAEPATKTLEEKGDTAFDKEVLLPEGPEAKKKPVLKREASSEKVATVEPSARAVESPSLSVETAAPAITVEEEDTESEPEQQPKKRVKTSKRGPKTGGRRKKTPLSDVSDDDDDDEEQKEVERKVGALSDEIKGRFGQIAWAKMGGYPYWPCIITDPRLLSVKLQETAVKALETKYLVFFYVSKNFAPVSFKWIEAWDDTKFKYREGYPEKDSKAPKRREKLMAAIAAADKETKLPIEDRANGLMRPVEREKLVVTPTPVKRKPGRPPKNKTAIKTTPKQTQKKRQQKDDPANGSDAKKASANMAEEEEDAAGPALSKEEIKAKVASRKMPKMKEADGAASGTRVSAKKTVKTPAKYGKSNGFAEIDSKRKKEIELVVPHKSVRSADIREISEEAAKKKPGTLKSKTKPDKRKYKVGDLGVFASKMARLQAKESARNNDELVGMMQELFKETLMYRSDVERSGLAAIIAILRKSLSPTVGHTASALRKHMINILSNNTDSTTVLGKRPHDATEQGTKKRKAENGSRVKVEEQQQKPVVGSSLSTTADVGAQGPSTSTNVNKVEGTLPKGDAVKTEEKASIRPVEGAAAKNAQLGDMSEGAEETVGDDGVSSVDKQMTSPSTMADKHADSAAKDNEDMFEAPEHTDKNRLIFVEMLSKILDHDGSRRADLANEIEAALFERFKESNDDYLTQARIIIFGLKENAAMRDRLFSGALHCLEFAYADDAFFCKTIE